jgi:hypothetical protein
MRLAGTGRAASRPTRCYHDRDGLTSPGRSARTAVESARALVTSLRYAARWYIRIAFCANVFE